MKKYHISLERYKNNKWQGSLGLAKTFNTYNEEKIRKYVQAEMEDSFNKSLLKNDDIIVIVYEFSGHELTNKIKLTMQD